MARLPTISPTKVSTYLACPVKYRWTYVDERGKLYMRSKSYFSFGTSLHKALQRLHDSDDAGVQTTEEVVGALDEAWVSAGYLSVTEAGEAQAEGRRILRDYAERTEEIRREGRTLFVEKRLRIAFERFALLGIVDRIDEHPDGTLEIVDYKSGRGEVRPEDVADDLSMLIYGLLVAEKFPDRRITATIIALRTGSSATVEFTPAALAEVRADVLEIGHEILDRDYPAIDPVAKRICLHCDFLRLCKAHPGFQEELSEIERTLAEAASAAIAST